MEKLAHKLLAENIKKTRIEKNLTQEQLSEQSGVPYKYIQKIEGKNPPNLQINTIERIAKALNTPLDILTKF